MAMLLLFYTGNANARQLSRRFTVKDGLPSNLIYSMVQDNKGFLWIATDNGLARFDGKYFRTYTTDNGLPDNEILEVRKENDGTIWVNTFKQGPFYFDETTNSFVDPLKNLPVKRDFVKFVLHVRVLQEGGIVFYNNNIELVFKNRQYVQLPYKTAFSYPDGAGRAYLYSELKPKGKIENYVYFRQGNRFDSALLYTSTDNAYVKFLRDSSLYLLTKNMLYVVTYNKARSKFNVKTINPPEELSFFRLTDNNLNITTTKGNIFMYDRLGLHRKYAIQEHYFANCVLEDDEKNIWVGTLNRGLHLYRLSSISLMPDGTDADKNFLSVMAAQNGTIYAGNYYGEILRSAAGGRQDVLRPFGHGNQVWIRAIIDHHTGKIFAVSEAAVLADLKHKVTLHNDLLIRMKDISVFNDSLIVAGGVNPRGGLFKINIKNNKASPLNSGLVRISKVAGVGGRYVYCSTNEGLYKYDFLLDKVVNNFSHTPLAFERILEVEATPDSLLIVATPTRGIYIMKNDAIISRLDNELLINNAVTDIIATPNKSFWISTRNGFSKVMYTVNGNRFSYKTNNFSMSEGLPANVITDISYRNDTIFLATENGIASVPEGITSETIFINTYLTAIKVNQENLQLDEDNKYTLDYSQRSVWLEFSGVDLSGHLKRLQYSFDKNKGWINLDGDDLSLELAAGTHTLLVRAVDINGNGNHPVTTIRFNVIAPFYIRTWFIVLMAALAAGLIVFIIVKTRATRQKRALRSQLQIEQERNRITADLHDDIGSTLSSLQIYSDIAYNLIDKDKEKAKSLLQQIAAGTSKISENIGDIIWSMKPNQAYALSFESRIKNIVSEALGPTDIDYEFQLDPSVDEKLTCIACRKNLILIVKEAINNIAKYSRAAKVNVSLQYQNKYCLLNIKDDGVGMNADEKKFAGNGLFNMQKRMNEIGGTFEIISSAGNGTEIICRFPATDEGHTGAKKQ